MAIPTTKTSKEKRGDDIAVCGICVRDNQQCKRISTLSLDSKDASTKLRPNHLLSISYPNLSCTCNYRENIGSVKEHINGDCKVQLLTKDEQNRSYHSDEAILSNDESETHKSADINGSNAIDSILFIDNNSLEYADDISVTNADNPYDEVFSIRSNSSQDRGSLKDYKDNHISKENGKKYSSSSHKVQFADMAVFDGNGDIQLSPRVIKCHKDRERKTRGTCDQEAQRLGSRAITASVEAMEETDTDIVFNSRVRLKQCMCPESPNRNIADYNSDVNDNDYRTNGECKTCYPHSRERTMSESSYFSNVSSVSLASKLTTGTTSSDTSSSSSSSSSSSTASYSHVAPDGGWGWVIVFAAFLVNMIADGVTFSVGVMFVDFQKEFGHSKSRTAGVIGLFHAIPLLSGPIASALTDRYGCRKVTIAGSIIATLGFLLSSLANTLEVLYFTFGVVSGFGLSLCYVAAVVIVAYYFERRRSFATGISVCGSGVGTFVFAPLTRVLIEEYGWRGACVILAGCFLNMCVCGALFRDLEWTVNKRKRKKMKHKLSITKSISPTLENVKIHNQNCKRASIGSSINFHGSRKLSTPLKRPEIEELKLKLFEGRDLTTVYSKDDIADYAYFTSSLCHLPTWISNAAETEEHIPADFLNVLSKNEKACDMIKENFPDSLIALSLRDTNSRDVVDDEAQECDDTLEISGNGRPIPPLVSGKNVAKSNPHNVVNGKALPDTKTGYSDISNTEKLRINTPKLVRKVSGYFKKCQNQILSETNHNQEVFETPKSILKKKRNVSYVAGEDEDIIKDLSMDEVEDRETRNEVNRSYSCRRTSGTDALIRRGDHTQQRSMYLHRLRLRRQSMTYRGAMLNIPRYRLRSSNSCPDIFKNSMTTIAAEEFAMGKYIKSYTSFEHIYRLHYIGKNQNQNDKNMNTFI